jgi:hypothetical protein
MFRILFLALTVLPLSAEVWTYPAPSEAFRSPDYTVRITQAGRTQDSFVYRHEHQDEKLRERDTDFNHWTTFSFSGQVTVTVTRLTGNAAGCTILPSAQQVTPLVEGRSVTFSLDHPAKLFVRFPGAEENPLFLFADAPEEAVPDRHDPNVIWFEAGKVTDIGERFTIKSGQTVYIPGGAYVKGTITADDASHITVRGRGILSGLDYARRPGVKGIPYNSIMFAGQGDHQLVEGITITNPQHFCILSRGQMDVRNVKLFGWWHQTDGWGSGDDSSIRDSFIKVNDDNVKFYGRNQIARDLVIYQQINGAPFQLGWGGAGQNARNCLAENIDVVGCAAATKTEREGNQAFLNLRNQSAESVIDGVILRNIRVDCDLPMLVGLTQVKGQVRNLHFENVRIAGKINGTNFVRTESSGVVSNVTLTNVTVSGPPVTETGTGLKWSTTGQVSPVRVLP